MALVEVKVPDIGDFDEVAVIELLVKPGDTVKAEQSLITVESDKASMEIPSSTAGVVKVLKVKLGDKVKEGSVVLVWRLKVRLLRLQLLPPLLHLHPLRHQRPPPHPPQPLRKQVQHPLLAQRLAPWKCVCLTLATSKMWP